MLLYIGISESKVLNDLPTLGEVHITGETLRAVVMTLNSVFVLDTTKKPLTPCSSARARILLRDSKAAVWRAVPFTIILKVAKPDAAPHPLTVKIDPGSKTTGLALVDCENQVVFAA